MIRMISAKNDAFSHISDIELDIERELVLVHVDRMHDEL